MTVEKSKLDRLLESADAVVNKHSGLRVNGKVSSLRTQEYSKQLMRETCRRLHSLGFYLTDVRGLGERHIEAIVKSWYLQKMSNKTVQNQFSRLKIFCGWLGKSEVINRPGVGVHPYLAGVADYAEITPDKLKVRTITEKSKSWSGNGIDVVTEINRARAEDSRFGAMLLMGLAFGLRKKEQLRITPWKADKGFALEIEKGVAKGGKLRTLPIEQGVYGQFQRWCLDQAKKECLKRETLGWPHKSYKQNENSYYHIARKLGFTKELLGVCMHGLRAEFAENMAMVRGLMPPSLGGSTSQMPKETRVAITDQISDLLGHDQEHTIGAYFSSFRLLPRSDGIGRRIGSVLVSAETDTFGSVHVNPPVIEAKDGSYREKSAAERAETVVTISIERLGRKQSDMGLAEFLVTHPVLTHKIIELLKIVGLGGDHES